MTIEIPDSVAASLAAPERDLAREYMRYTLDDLKNHVEVAPLTERLA